MRCRTKKKSSEVGWSVLHGPSVGIRWSGWAAYFSSFPFDFSAAISSLLQFLKESKVKSGSVLGEKEF
jgi:hypothetical protein